MEAKYAHVVDLRSDTVTKPTDDMREAMKNAIVGDDVFGDDPTVKELEAKAAALLGKEAGLYVTSGTMGNLLCVLTHCNGRGEEFIVGDQAHIYTAEQGGSATIGGVHPRVVPTNPDATLSLDRVEAAICPDDIHWPITKLVCIENSHNRLGGRVVSPEYIDQLGVLCKRRGLALHMDGARLMNAAAALGVPPSRIVAACDTVSLCLSKGLGAPVGSIIVGPKEFIARCRRLRKALGGGTRQIGVLAAPAIIALEKMPEKLKLDHENAKKFANAIQQFKDEGVSVSLDEVQTNMVIFRFNRKDATAAEFCKLLSGKNVHVIPFSYGIRAAFHHQIQTSDVDVMVERMKEVFSELNAKK
jgi:threonine aldolase